VTLPASAPLAGAATDDGRPDPPGSLEVGWSKASGPGTVVFAHANAPVTSAGFTKAGAYVLRLSVTDSELTVVDEVTVVVTGSPGHKKASCQGASGPVQVGRTTDDVLIGTPGVDVIRGRGGDDLVLGRSGADCLVGGAGQDRLRGQAGADRLNPGPGRDKVTGGGGDDVIVSVDGKRDVIRCGGGHDRVTVDKRDRVAASCERVVVRPIGG
jgi:Ca2+-binding RTX toxin-like protein